MVGLLVGLLLAVMRERFDRTVADPTDLATMLASPLLAAIPDDAAYRVPAAPRSPLPAGAHLEVFRLLRAHLRYFQVGRDVQVIVLTSAGPGAGKSTVSHHLAIAASATGQRVLELESDLRRPTLAIRSGRSVGPRTGPRC